MNLSKSICGIFFLCIFTSCDAIRHTNSLDPNSSAYSPAKVTVESFPLSAGNVRIERASEAEITASVIATSNAGWKFHHWIGREYSGESGTALPIKLRGSGDSLHLIASFVPTWIESDSVLVDDFDTPDDFTEAGRHSSDLEITLRGLGLSNLHSGWVFTAGEKTIVFPPEVKQTAGGDGDWRNTRAVGEGWDGGNCLHVGANMSSGWANASVQLRSYLVGQNLTKLQKISFWAKGNGSIKVGALSIEGILLGDYSKMLSKDIILTSGWKRYEIDPNSFAFPSWTMMRAIGKHLTWKDHAHSINQLQFEFTSTDTDLWLDDIWLIGTPIYDYAE